MSGTTASRRATDTSSGRSRGRRCSAEQGHSCGQELLACSLVSGRWLPHDTVACQDGTAEYLHHQAITIYAR